jgi:5-formyltetrahydrofolate cyclo-ligase
MQVLAEELPWTYHDVPVDYAVTPAETIRCLSRLPHPTGIYWGDLDEDKIAQIPLLQKLRLAQAR